MEFTKASHPKKFLTYEKKEKKIQTFPQICRYSCSKNDEKRNFELFHEWYEIVIFEKFHFKFFEAIKIRCTNCNWRASFPSNFAKKLFHKGLDSHLLMKFAESKILKSRVLNIYGSLWRIWLIVFGFLLVISIFDYRRQNIKINEPKVVSINDIFDKSNVNKFVTINGKADYSFAFRYEIRNEENNVIDRRAYFPLFLQTNSSDFIIISVDGAAAQNATNRSSANYDLLRNQDYTVTGKLVTIDKLRNTELENFFVNEFPSSKNLNRPTLMIDASGVISLPQFIKKYIRYYVYTIILLASSIAIQIYIDKKLFMKKSRAKNN